PVQPVCQATARSPPRPAAHGRGQRAVPARGRRQAGPNRWARRWRRPRDRHVTGEHAAIGRAAIALSSSDPIEGSAATRSARVPSRFPQGLLGLLVVSTLLRLAGLSSPGHAGDIGAFVQWAEGLARWGLGGYYAHAG